MHPCALCIHVPHLDLVDIGWNMSTTVRLMGTLNPIKKNSYWSTLQPCNPYTLGNVPCFCPIKNFFILTLHTLRQSLDWPLISILTHQKTFTSSLFKRKLLIAQILKRWLLVAKQVPYKFPNNIASKLLTLHAINWWFVCQPKNAESSRSMQFYKYYFSENLIKLQNHIYIM